MKTNNETKLLSPEEKQELLEAMNAHFQTYLRARSLTPYIPKSEMGEPGSHQLDECFLVTTSPLYHRYGYHCHFIFDAGQFDTKEKYMQYQDICHWINQSFLVELKCILDSYIRDWNNSPLAEEKHFKLLQKCRDLFAHSSYKLSYKPRKGHEHDYEHAYDLYNDLYRELVEADSMLNLSITEFVIPFYSKLIELVNEKI